MRKIKSLHKKVRKENQEALKHLVSAPVKTFINFEYFHLYISLNDVLHLYLLLEQDFAKASKIK